MDNYTTLVSGEDHRGDLLRTETVRAVLDALKGPANIFGTGHTDWTGTILVSDATMVTSSNWSVADGALYRYNVVVNVEVQRTTLREPEGSKECPTCHSPDSTRGHRESCKGSA